MRMNRWILTVWALVLALTGIVLIFIPDESMHATGIGGSDALAFKLLGAAHFGFAMLNYMARTAAIGGIYGRPISVANFAHFMIAAITLIKVSSDGEINVLRWFVTIVFSLLAVSAFYVMRSNPGKG